MSAVLQRTDEWHNEKLCVISGTRAYNLMSSAITRRTLMAQIIREIVTADTKGFSSPDLERRGQMEPEAAAVYRFLTGEKVTGEDSYLIHPKYPLLAVSPDGLVGDEGGLEIKRLDEENHIKVWIGGPHEKKYILQSHWGMFITGRKWWDLLYYCETLPDTMRAHVHRIKRKDSMMQDFEDTANQFFDELRTHLQRAGLGGLL